MPTVRVAMPPEAWTKEEKKTLIQALTNATAETALKLGKGDIKNFVAVQIDETAAGGYAMGGKVLG